MAEMFFRREREREREERERESMSARSLCRNASFYNCLNWVLGS